MFTSEPWWLFWTKAFIGMARPFINWILGPYVGLGIFFFVFYGLCALSFEAETTGTVSLMTILIGPMLAYFCAAPLVILWGISVLILILLNVKFSIGWRQ